MIKFERISGELSLDGKTLCGYPQSYSGFQAGRNNPKLEHMPDVGPIPAGLWKITTWYPQYEGKGVIVGRLTPFAGTVTFGRAGFLIHGDSVNAPGMASHGCIILPRVIRIQLSDLFPKEDVVAVV